MSFTSKGYLLLLILNLISCVYFQQTDPAYLQLHNTAELGCEQETGYSAEAANSATIQSVSQGDEKFKCYEKCILLKMDCMDNAGNVSTDGIQKLLAYRLNVTVSDDDVENCKTAEGSDRSDLCQVAFDFIKCATEGLSG